MERGYNIKHVMEREHDEYCPLRNITKLDGYCCECDTIGVLREVMLEHAAHIIYKHCSHTKSEGSPPCWHDQMVHELYEEQP